MNELVSQFDCGPGYFADVQASGMQMPEDWFFESVAWGSSDSGETVNPRTALGHGPVWQAVNILAGDVGQLPWHKMIASEDFKGAEKDRKHPTEWLINDQPNGFQTPSMWREWTMSTALLWGNGISLIRRNPAGERELLPLPPERTSYHEGGSEGYFITTWLGDRAYDFNPSQLFHVRGLSSDGFWGLSAVTVAKNVIGHGLALQRHGNSVFKNGARPSGVLENPGKIPPPEVRSEYRREWNEVHKGANNTGNVAFLYGGTIYKPMSMSNDDAQWLEARDLDREFIASLFGLPSFKLNANKNSAVRANIEEQNRDYFNTSLSRWLNRFNEEACRKLLSMNERRSGRHFYRWYPEGFLRGDIQKRYAAYSQAITSRILSPNEVRALEDLNPYEGGDEYLNPAIDQAPSDGEPPKPDDDAQKSTAENLMRRQVAALLETEAKAVEKAAETARNLTRWAENYYESYQKTAENFLDLAAQLAGFSGFAAADWRRAACDHARDSLNRLLAMAGLVGKDGLAEIGRDMAASIRGQVEQFTAAILGDKGNG